MKILNQKEQYKAALYDGIFHVDNLTYFLKEIIRINDESNNNKKRHLSSIYFFENE